jgi:hypothetical protein
MRRDGPVLLCGRIDCFELAGRFEPDHFRCRPTVQAPNERNARFVAKAVAGLGPGPTAKAIVSARLELAIACSPKR